MKYYIASRLGNYTQVQLLAEKLNGAGWVHTYDWTKEWVRQHRTTRSAGSEKEMSQEALSVIAVKEAQGVAAADIVIVLTPKGRGTHTELGMAIALGKTVFLCHEDDTYFKCDDNTASFYFHPAVIRLVGKTDDIAAMVLRHATSIL